MKRNSFILWFCLFICFCCFLGCSNLFDSNKMGTVSFSFSLERNLQNSRGARTTAELDNYVLKLDLCNKKGDVLQSIEKSVTYENTEITFVNVPVSTEIYVYAVLSKNGENFLFGKSDLTKITSGENRIKLVLQYTSRTISAIDAADYIGNLTQGHYNLILTGDCTEEIYKSIFTALSEKENTTVSLDMSNVQGLYNAKRDNSNNNSEISCLVKIVLPENLTEIGDYAFLGCSSLTSVVIPTTVTSIGNSAFFGCSSLASVDIPVSVTRIGGNAFRGCSSLESITIPASLTSIGDYAFYGCTGLAIISYDGTETEWSEVTKGDDWLPTGKTVTYLKSDNSGNGGEGTTPDNDKITPDNAATVIAAYTIEGHYDITIEGKFGDNGENLQSIANAINKNDNITSVSLDLSNAELSGVPNDTFKDCIKLKTIILPDNRTNEYGSSYGGVSSINSYAFAGCTSLTSITLPASLNGIYMDAFAGCTSLTTIHFNGTEEKWNTLNGEDSGIDENININYLTSYPVLAKDAPSIIQSYSSPANYILVIVCVCTEDQLENIVEAMNCIQNSGTTVSLDLYGTTGLTEIPANCFENCTELAKIILPEGITSIGANAFSGCEELFSIYFPTSLEIIGENAFTNCHEELYYNAKYGGKNWNLVEGGDSFNPYVNKKPY